MNEPYIKEISTQGIIDKINNLDEQLFDEQQKTIDERNAQREFELMYAKFMAGLKLNTGIKIF